MNFSFPGYYRLVPASFLEARRARVQERLGQLKLDALLLTHAVDIYYLSGTMQQGVVFLDSSGEIKVFMRRHVERAQAETPLPVIPVSSLSQVVQALDLPPGAKLGLNLDVVSGKDLLAWQSRLPGVEMSDFSAPWLEVMGIKDDFELEIMTRAGLLAQDAYQAVPGWLRPGLSEAELAGLLQQRAMGQGHIDLMRSRHAYMETYSWHVVSGAQGSWPSAVDSPYSGLGLSPAFPSGASLKPIAPGEPVIVDFGLCLEGYQTDQTRTFVLGQANDELHRAHQCLESVERVILERLRPGAVSGEVFAAGQDEARRLGMARFYLGRDGHRIRFAGHGVGLELGVPPYLLQGSQARVRAGQCYALELKIVLEQGPVGLENTVLVNPEGPPTLFTPMYRRLIEVER